ncbi:hypothetical protein CEXT_469841 [Caerostris extrusa]|uniref:Uncharacterized protein n=1 Tax=Caerostris extrusa TaxID=172846 RepID=A0AAV4YGE0_CAEEX|nr:hypothetical protein CEXT_469841 [Caerostris extrusa]
MPCHMLRQPRIKTSSCATRAFTLERPPGKHTEKFPIDSEKGCKDVVLKSVSIQGQTLRKGKINEKKPFFLKSNVGSEKKNKNTILVFEENGNSSHKI